MICCTVNTYLKYDKDYPDDYLSIFMAIMGDGSDDVPGIKGLGAKRTEELIEEVITAGGSVEEMRNNSICGKSLFSIAPEKMQNKNMIKVLESEEIISRNLKLVDFEVISSIIDDPPNTEILAKRKSIEDVFNNKKEFDKDSLLLALRKTGVDIPQDIEYLFRS
jgi:5'-3' exonuclease